MKKLTILLILLSSLFLTLRAQELTWESYPVLEGNNIYKIYVDKENNKWFSSIYRDQIAKFDNTNWEIWDHSNTPMPESSDIRCVYEDSESNLWFATPPNDGLFRFDGSTWTQIKKPGTGTFTNTFVDIDEDSEGSLWLAHSAKPYGVSIYDGTNWSAYTIYNSGLPDNLVVATTISPYDGKKWLLNWGGISVFDGTNWVTYKASDIGIQNTYWMTEEIFIDNQNRAWIGSSNEGVFYFDGTNWNNFNTSNSGIAHNEVRNIGEDQDGNIWFATASGPSKFDGQSWTNFPDIGKVYSVNVDSDGAIWFGGQGEVFKFSITSVNNILTIKTAGSSLITKVAISSSKEFNEVSDQNEEALRVVEIDQDNTAYFSEEMIEAFGNDIQRLDLLAENNQLMGHILFEYSQEDFANGKTIDLFLRLHTDLSTNRLDYPGWSYYSDTYVEWPTSMLIAPENSFDSVKVDQRPVLFVHGVSGAYPYWGETPVKIETVDKYDVWQFYYPYDGEIETSGIMEHRAIDDILDQSIVSKQYTSPRMPVVVHSMGGLVTRSNIQTHPDSDTRIAKFLELGSPNYGALIAHRVYYDKLTGFIAGFLPNKDNYAPAYKEMTPGSNFLHNLNKLSFHDLYQGNILSEISLVVAGTEDFYFGLPHEETSYQEDGMVSVSSASLLNYNIPLATTNLSHALVENNLTNSASDIILKFLEDSYTPQSLLDLPEITGLWLNATDPPLRTPGGSFDPDKGILTLKIPGTNLENLYLLQTENDVIRLLSGGVFSTNYYLQNIPQTNNYFCINTEGINDLGVGFTEGNHKLVFQYFDNNLLRWIKYKAYENFDFHYLQTNMYTLDLSNGELAILNSVNESQGGNNQPLSKASSLHKTQENIQTYVIDGATTGAVFLINAEQGESQFSQHGMKLVSPSGQEIDPAVASSDPDIEFKEDTDEGFAFYYIANPEVGTWTLQTNEVVQVVTSVPVVSQATMNITVTNGNYFTGDPIPFSVITSSNISNPALSISIQKQNGSTWTSVGNASATAVNDTVFTGNAFVGVEGTYRLQATLTGQLNGENFERVDISESFWIEQLVLPEIKIDISLQNPTFYMGDTTVCDMNISGDYNNPEVTLSVWQKDSLGIWRDFDSGTVIRVSTSHYTGSFLAPEIGEYRFKARVSDNVDGYDIHDTAYALFTVLPLPEVSLSLWMPDSSIYLGDSTLCTILLTPICENPTFEFFIQKQSIEDDILIWKNKDTLEVKAINDTLFNVKFALVDTGNYRIQTEISCTIDAKELSAKDSLVFSVIPLPQIQLSLSLSDSTFYQSDSVSYQILISSNCTSPEVNISLWKKNENVWDSLKTLEFNSVDDTTFWGSFLAPDTGKYKINAILKGFVEGHFRRVKDSLFFSVLPDTITTGISSGEIPHEFKLNQNYPNPFNPSTIIEYSLPHQSNVELKIFNILGQEVLILVNETQSPGNYKVLLDMTRYPSGVYVYQIRADNFRDVKKLLLIK